VIPLLHTGQFSERFRDKGLIMYLYLYYIKSSLSTFYLSTDAVAYLCIQAGLYIMTVFDWYSGGLNVIVIALCEVCGIAWIYGM